MDRVNIRIGHLEFDHADYDVDGDILYLHIGPPQASESEETPEGHAIHYAPSTRVVVGLTVVNAKWLIARDGHLTVIIPEVIEASADDLAAGLAAA